MDKLTFKEWSILSDLETIAPLGEDFEFSMARGELKTAKSAIERLMRHLKGEGDLEAWVQSKITKASEYLDTVADHMDGGEDDTVKKEDVKENIEICDANEKVFAHVVDVISGDDYEFKSLGQPIEEKKGLWDNIHAKRKRGERPAKPGEKGYPKTLDIEEGLKQARKNVGAGKCWDGYVAKGTKKKGGKEVPNCVPVTEESDQVRYCPKCKKKETAKECRYGEKYWKMFSIPSSLDPNPYDPNEVHPANENVSFEIGGGHRQAQRTAKIRNLAKGTTNAGEKAAAMKKLSGPSLPLADSVIQPGQLTNEDYQRIQSTGNVYTILFSWRGRSMMSLQMFFPNMKRPSKDEVNREIQKFYPGAVILQWYPSPTDSSKPIVVIQGK
jgi:hypothetical protein